MKTRKSLIGKVAISLSISFLLIFACNGCALSKCPSEIYKVKGLIVSYDESYKDIPVKDALVSVFFDDFDYGLSGYNLDNGEYEIRCWYKTYSGWTFFGGDSCGKKPYLITIVVHKDGNFTNKTIFKIDSLKFLKEDNKFIIPAIRITPIGNTLIY